jgi:hypothetical protein
LFQFYSITSVSLYNCRAVYKLISPSIAKKHNLVQTVYLCTLSTERKLRNHTHVQHKSSLCVRQSMITLPVQIVQRFLHILLDRGF